MPLLSVPIVPRCMQHASVRSCDYAASWSLTRVEFNSLLFALARDTEHLHRIFKRGFSLSLISMENHRDIVTFLKGISLSTACAPYLNGHLACTSKRPAHWQQVLPVFSTMPMSK